MEPIQLALLLPSTGVWSWSTGSHIAGAAALAVEEVNDDASLLPGHLLKYKVANSGCNAQQGLKALGVLLGGNSMVNAIIGPACSSACEVSICTYPFRKALP